MALIKKFADSGFDPAVDAHIAPELTRLTRERDMSLARILFGLPGLKGGSGKVFILSGFGHFDPEQSPLSSVLLSHQVPHMLLKPIGASDSADDASLRQHYETQMRNKPAGQ